MIDVRNSADSLVHSTEKNLADYGDKVPEEDKAAIETAIQELKDVLVAEDGDVEEITAKTGTLTEASMKLGEAMYKESQAEAPMGADDIDSSPAETPEDTTVVDADFEEVDPDEVKKKD
jgi:molecular chaperone DnaK